MEGLLLKLIGGGIPFDFGTFIPSATFIPVFSSKKSVKCSNSRMYGYFSGTSLRPSKNIIVGYPRMSYLDMNVLCLSTSTFAITNLSEANAKFSPSCFQSGSSSTQYLQY